MPTRHNASRDATRPRVPSTLVSIFVVTLAAAGISLRGQTASIGEWSSVFNMPLVAVHVALMHTGEVLMFDAWEIPGTPSARLWNPQTNTFTSAPNGFAELFCAGHVLGSDGRLFTAGGHNGGGVGTTDATVFDVSTRQWTQLSGMNYARWYPALTQLPDGRLLTLGGSISRPDVAEIPEVFSIGSNSWSPLPSAQKDLGEYPVVFPAPDGRVFVAGADGSYTSWFLGVGTQTWSLVGQSPAGAGVAVMYRPGRVMMTGGGTGGADPVIPSTGVIDLNSPLPAWRTTAPMAFGRAQHNLVILPDGKVLAVGGSTEVSLISTSGVLPAEIWDPDTETWSTVASMATPRMYHSTALLLPDGRVFSGGGGRLAPAIDYPNGEIYSPPYLFRGARPIITSSPSAIAHGSSFALDTPDPAAVARVTLVRTSSVTHTSNYDQRFIELSFTSAGPTQLSVQAPAGPAEAPAGYYLLFVLDANGVPSMGRVVRVDGTPTGPTLSVSDANVVEGTDGATHAVFSVTRTDSTTGTASVNYLTADVSANAGSDYAEATGTLTFPPGTSSRTVSVPIVPDGVTEPNETFTLTLSNPVNATLLDGTGIGTIIDDDAPLVPVLSINSVSVREGTGTGTPVASFTVTLAQAGAHDVLVSFRTLPGGAVSPDDFASTNGTLTFAGGTTVQTVQVPIVPDALGESDETFVVELFNPVNATVVGATGVGTILNDDRVTVAFGVAAGNDDANEDGAQFSSGTSYVWFGNGSSAAASYAGLRFPGVSIPAGATVISARVEVEAAATQWIPLRLEFAAEASANGMAFSPASRPSQRQLLSPRIAHSSDMQWVAGTRYRLDEIGPLVQAVVNLPGWASGRVLTFILKGTGNSWSRKFASSYETAPPRAPKLIVTYEPGAPPNAPPVITSAVATPLQGSAPLTVTFSAAATDAEGDPLTYTWTFGDGASAMGVAAAHTYAAAGPYNATVTVSDGHQQTMSTPLAVQVTGPAQPTLTISDVATAEGTGGTTSMSFTVALSAQPGVSTVTVGYATADGTAVAPADYVSSTGTITFTGTTTTQTITVPVNADAAAEPDESFTVTLSNPTNATLADASAVGTITNDDVVLPTLSVADVTVVEGTGGTTTATFTVALSAASTQAVTVAYATMNGAAVAPGDFTAATGTLTFTPGQTSQPIPVAVVTDAAVEPDESFTVTLSNPTNATLADASAVGTIANDDVVLPTLSVADVTVVEGTGGTTTATFTVALSAASTQAVTVAYATMNGAAVAPGDFTAATGTLTFTPGQTSQPIPVAVVTDAAVEPDESFTVTLSNPTNATLADASAVGTIANDDVVLPTLSVADVTVVEGTGGTTTATFTVALSAASTQPVTVAYATMNGAAVAPGDFTAAAGTLTFTPGQTSQPIPVAVVTDAAVEPDEGFTVTLNNPTSATIGDGVAVGTIANDDVLLPPTLSVSDVAVAEGTGGSTTATFTVTLSTSSAQPVSVTYATANATAVAPGDFSATTGTLTFTPGLTSMPILVPLVTDAVGETNETFVVELSNPVNAAIADASGTGTILNDDTVTAVFSIVAGPDDVNEDGTQFSSGAAYGWLGNGSSATASFAGLRFANVTIPFGATIISARVEIEAAATQWIPLQLEFAAEASANSVPFSPASRPSQRLLLAPRVTHSSNAQWLSGTRYSLDEVGPLVQAVVNLDGWTSGRALTVIVKGTRSSWSRKFVSFYETAPQRAPRLIVTYEPGAPATP